HRARLARGPPDGRHHRSVRTGCRLGGNDRGAPPSAESADLRRPSNLTRVAPVEEAGLLDPAVRGPGRRPPFRSVRGGRTITRTRRTLATVAAVGLLPALAACSGSEAPGESGGSSTDGELS